MENKKENWVDKVLTGSIFVLMVLLVGSVVLLGCKLVYDLFVVVEEAHETTVETKYIKSINYANSTEGSFFLGCSSIETEEYFVCYEMLEDGGITLLKLEAEKTIIYETLDPGDKACAEIETDGWGYCKGIKLYVPQNTVQVKYDLSLD